jgi:regulator of sirC expression with transglutaminase-like and TPR domain
VSDDQFIALDYIEASAGKADEHIDAGKLALAMVYDDHAGLALPSLKRYFYHFKVIAEKVMYRYRALIDAGSDDNTGVRLAALKDVIAHELGYERDEPECEILESVDMIRVIDRGRGDSIALGLLYIDAARKCGWRIEGLDVASHFLCRIEHNGEREIFDPADGCRVMHAHDLRSIVKERLGERAELLPEYMEGMDIRACIICLCDVLKSRRIEMGEYEKALEMVERMHLLKPEGGRLLLDAGVLYARIGNTEKARACLEDYIEHAPTSYDLYEAKVLLNELDRS